MNDPRMEVPAPILVETEFKLALDPRDIGALKRHALLAGKTAKRVRQVDVYFDTPDLRLARNGLALRLRRAGGRWLQTLKDGGRVTAGLHQRGEWEFPLPRPSLDLRFLADTPFGKLPSDVGPKLQPAFTVKVMRTSWVVAPDAAGRIEIVLDRGVLICGERELPICEVELELLAGDANCLFRVAAALQEDCSLKPESDSKSERGYRMIRGEPLHPAHAEPVHLDPGSTLPMALRHIARSSLAHLHANEAGVLASDNGEFLHQARVALRRLRSALKFAGAAPGGILAELKWFSGALGPARDWDVFVCDILPPALRAYGDVAEARRIARQARRQRKASFAAARLAFGSRRYFALLLEVSRWLLESVPPGAEISPAAFAARRIGKRHKRLLCDAIGLAGQTPQQRHRVRIDAKRLRYAVEHFGSLFHGKSVRRYARDLSALQDILGSVNDAVTAERLLAQVPLAEGPGAFMRGWLAARSAGDIALAQELVARLGGHKRFWM